MRLGILLLMLGFLASCHKDKKDDHASFTVQVEYSVDGMPLQLDTVKYPHPVGYNFGVSSLRYFISNLEIVKSDGSRYKFTDAHYMEVGAVGKNEFTLTNLPVGDYKGVYFMVGLDSNSNKTDGLPNTADNINMAWPDVMGGGYHFMKLEGLYQDSSGLHGYAMHMGKTGNAVLVQLPSRTFSIVANANNKLTLKMNIAEWFKNPYLYDFNKDGNYSMGDSLATLKLKNNGADIFNE